MIENLKYKLFDVLILVAVSAPYVANADSKGVETRLDDIEKRLARIEAGMALNEAYSPKFEKGDPTSSVMTMSELNAIRSDPTALIAQVRGVPYFRDGKALGVRMFAIRQGGIYEKLLFRNGDIITSINGSPLVEPLSLYTWIALGDPKKDPFAKIELVRDRKEILMTVRVSGK